MIVSRSATPCANHALLAYGGRKSRPFRRNLSVHDKAGERAFHRTLSAPKGHSSPFRHLCVQGTAAPAPPPCTLAKCAAPYGWQTAHLLSVLPHMAECAAAYGWRTAHLLSVQPPHNTCPPRKAKAPVSAISPFPHKSHSAASPQFSPSRNAPPPVNATKPSRHCAHSGKTPESGLFRAAKGKSTGIHCARGNRNRPPQQANTQPQICENIKTSRPQEKVFPFHGVGFRENVPCLRCTKSNA